MFSNRVAFIALAVACVAAAGGGGYLATRQNVKPAAPAPAAVALPEAPAHVGKPVQETEAVIGDTRTGQALSGQPAAAAEAPSVAPAQLKRDAAPSRAAAGRRTADATTARRINQQLPTLE